jgi:hypothetical protein
MSEVPEPSKVTSLFARLEQAEQDLLPNLKDLLTESMASCITGDPKDADEIMARARELAATAGAKRGGVLLTIAWTDALADVRDRSTP